MSEYHVILVIFCAFIVFNFLLLAGLLLFRKNNSSANVVLGIFVFLTAVLLLNNILVYQDAFIQQIYMNYLIGVIPFLFGPLILLYLRYMRGKTWQPKWEDLWHVLPVFPVIAYTIYVSSLDWEQKEILFDRVVHSEDVFTNAIYIASILHLFVYLIIAFNDVKDYEKDARSVLSSLDELKIDWMLAFIKILIFFILFLLVFYSLQMLFFPNLLIYSELLATPFVALVVYLMITYAAFNHNAILDDRKFQLLTAANMNLEKLVGVEGSKKNNENDNPAFDFSELKKNLLDCVEAEEMYLQRDLTIQRLADYMKCSKKVLSKCINQEFGMSFFEFINKYRVEKAKELLTNQENDYLKVDAIGEMSGFNSRAGFYSVFKKITGSSPNEFKRELSQ